MSIAREPTESYSVDEDGSILHITEFGPEDQFLLAQGFEEPNYTQIPNQILGTWNGKDFIVGQMSDMSEAELKVALALCRVTFGFHRDSGFGALSWLETATGLSRQGVLNGIERLTKRGLFIKDGKTKNGTTVWKKVHGSQPSRPPLVNEVDYPSQPSRPYKERTKKEQRNNPPRSGDDGESDSLPEERWVKAGEVGVENNQGQRWKTKKESLFGEDKNPEWEEGPKYVDLDDDGFPSVEKSPLVRHIGGKGRKLTANQEDKMSSGVPLHNPQYPSPNNLFVTDPLFRAYIDDKISWANGGVDGKRKTTGSLVTAIRNYETEKFGWLDFKQAHEEKEGETTHTPLPPGAPEVPIPTAEETEELIRWVEEETAGLPPPDFTRGKEVGDG